MSPFLLLAAAFASIILVGGGLVLVHDMVERHWHHGEPRPALRGGGGRAAPGRRRRHGDEWSGQHGGLVVWVRAGSGVVLGGGERQRQELSTQGPRRDVVTVRRASSR